MNLKNSSDYSKKLYRNMSEVLNKIDKPKILELGVRHGVSTKYFLEYCERNNGKLYSVDIDDCSNVSNSKNWKFIHCSDDEYDKIIDITGSGFDFIYIDSFHNAKHVAKIIYLYFMDLKKDGYIFVDDISWLIYSKKNIRDNFNCEINNYETFFEILNILNTNSDKIIVNFDFSSSGMCKIHKISSINLSKSKKILTRNFSLKNFARKLLRK